MVCQVLLLVLCAVGVDKSIGTVITAKDCGSVLGKVSTVVIGCDGRSDSEATGCSITAGGKYKGFVKVTPNTFISGGNIIAHVNFEGNIVRLPIPDYDLCAAHGVECPLKADSEVTVFFVIPIPSFFPMLASLKVELQTWHGQDLACFEFILLR